MDNQKWVERGNMVRIRIEKCPPSSEWGETEQLRNAWIGIVVQAEAADEAAENYFVSRDQAMEILTKKNPDAAKVIEQRGQMFCGKMSISATFCTTLKSSTITL